MPPIKTYKFKHKVSSIIDPISINIYGDLDKAWGILSNYVFSVSDWEYIQ